MNTFQLKLLALVFMVIDHIGLYFDGAPEVFRLIGRLSFPLFLFCMVQGYHYTHNRKKYLLRLYGMSIVMGTIMYFIDARYGNHNIFITLFWVGILISAVELFQRDLKKGCLAYALIAASHITFLFLQQLVPFLHSLNGDILYSFLPTLGYNEYGIFYVLLGVMMYFLRDNREMFCAAYLLLALIEFCDHNTQFLIAFALPFMLSYNHEKGRGMKWFFYLFYPAHTLLLFYFSQNMLF